MAATDRLVDAAADGGVEYDGLSVQADDGSFTVVLDGDRHEGLSAAEVRSLAAENTAYVTNWDYWQHTVGGEGTARRAFLRWVERAGERSVPSRYDALADGVTREWGQLRVTATLGEDGNRVYDLRHVDDADAAVDALETHDDPLDARDIGETDPSGRYRPLNTAPTLRDGWVFPSLDGDDLVHAVEYFYPASVANWHREREGDLDVTHYRETAERQTGIYDLVDELPEEAVANLAEACCVDSQCLKRREWDEDADTPLDVPRGDGEFPCREPCSLFVAAARKVTILESEEPREYTFELTPSEKNQLEELLDAVADGRVDEIREADLGDGANRYRARYLRAKRVTERGLCDVPTTQDD